MSSSSQLITLTTIVAHYERLPDFIHLVERLDPRGAFGNAWLGAPVLGPS